MGGTVATCPQGVQTPLPFHRTISALFIESNELLSSFKEKKKEKKKGQGEGEIKKNLKKKEKCKGCKEKCLEPSLCPSQNCVRLIFLAIMGENLRIFILQSKTKNLTFL